MSAAEGGLSKVNPIHKIAHLVSYVISYMLTYTQIVYARNTNVFCILYVVLGEKTS